MLCYWRSTYPTSRFPVSATARRRHLARSRNATYASYTCTSYRRRGVRMSVERNKDLARQAIGIWTTGVFDAVDELYAPEYVNHQHHDPDDPRDIHGAEAMKRFARKFREAFPDFHDSVDIQIAEGKIVESWANWDMMGMMQQLNAVSAPSERGSQEERANVRCAADSPHD